MDKFSLEAVDLGKLYKIRIRHDNSMFGPAWFLDKVDIDDPMDREKYTFYCERWLGKNKDDGKIDRTIYVKVSPKLHVHTGFFFKALICFWAP